MGEAKRRKDFQAKTGNTPKLGLTFKQRKTLEAVESLQSEFMQLFTKPYAELGRGCLISCYDSDGMGYTNLERLMVLKERSDLLNEEKYKDDKWIGHFFTECGDKVATLIDFVCHYNPQTCGVFCIINPMSENIFETTLVPFDAMTNLALKKLGLLVPPTDLSKYVDGDLLSRIVDETNNNSTDFVIDSYRVFLSKLVKN